MIFLVVKMIVHNFAASLYKLPTLAEIHLKHGENEQAANLIALYERESGLFHDNVLVDKSKEIYYNTKGQYYQES